LERMGAWTGAGLKASRPSDGDAYRTPALGTSEERGAAGRVALVCGPGIGHV